MSDEAATALVNLDGRKFRDRKSIIDVDWAALVDNDRYLYELLEDSRAGRMRVSVHADEEPDVPPARRPGRQPAGPVAPRQGGPGDVQSAG